MSSMELGACLFIQHADEDLLVLVDALHEIRMGLAKADQKRLEDAGVLKDLVSQELELLYVSEEGQGIVLGQGN